MEKEKTSMHLNMTRTGLNMEVLYLILIYICIRGGNI